VTSTHPMRARFLGLARIGLVAALIGSAATLVALPVSSASASASAHVRPGPVTVRVASYNIHAGAGEDNVFNLDRTAAAISSLHADVVGLEEVDVNWGTRSEWRNTLQDLGSRLHMHTAFAPIYDLDPLTPGQPRRQYGVALLSRYPIVSRENHEITRLSTQVPDPVPAPAPGFLEAVIQIRGARTHVYVTHLDYRADPLVRQLQVADTRRILSQDPLGAGQLLLGDFNAEPTASELQPLWQSVHDIWAEAPFTSGAGLTYPAIVPTKRIDFVTASPNISAVSAAIPADDLATTASDHRPMVATVQIPRGSENYR
jgi:endonuclease/exonuclease/phosphatase family metal-dependent hydrolase